MMVRVSCIAGLLAATACSEEDPSPNGTDSASSGASTGATTTSTGATSNSTGGSLLCGNGVMDPGEVCDGDVLDDATCATLVMGTGEVACADDCSAFDTSGCATATGACDGLATDDYWLCLMSLPMGNGGANIGQQFRSASELADAGGGGDVSYCFAGNSEVDGSGIACEADSYAQAQNAAKVVIPAGRHSIGGQPRPRVGVDDGDLVMTWDSWNAPEWYLGRSCADGGAIGTQKTFQVSAPPESNAGRWLELRQRYTGSSFAGGTVSGWNPITSLDAGTDVATVDVRSYGRLGAAAVAESTELAGQEADFVIRARTWTRYWVLIELNQGAPWTCGAASGNYALASIWMADESQAPTRLFNRAEVETTRVEGIVEGACDGDETVDEPPDDDLRALWFEYNSSSGNCPDGGLFDRIGYFRNFAALHTPMPDGVIAADASSLVVAGTEILVPPRP